MPRGLLAGLVALLSLLSLSDVARAQNLLTNHSFETGDLSGWTAGAGSCATSDDVHVVTNPANAVYGAYMVYFGGTGCEATLAQTVNVTAGITPVLTFSVFGNPGASAWFEFGTFVYHCDQLATPGAPGSLFMAAGITSGGYVPSTSGPLTVTFHAGGGTWIDAVGITEGADTTPEPSSVVLLGTGVAGLLPIAKRRSRGERRVTC